MWCTAQLLAEKAKEQVAPEPAAPPAATPTPAPLQSQEPVSQQAAPVAHMDPSTAWKLEKMELQVYMHDFPPVGVSS